MIDSPASSGSPKDQLESYSEASDDALEKASRLSFGRLIPMVVLAIGLATAFYLDLHHYLTFETLQQNRTAILEWKHENYTVSTLFYVIAYGLATAISIPGAIWLTIAGGFMFGTLKGGVLVVFGATLGATIIFLAARFAFADFFHAKCGAMIQKMEAGFQENAFSYLLVLRFVPLFPFGWSIWCRRFWASRPGLLSSPPLSASCPARLFMRASAMVSAISLIKAACRIWQRSGRRKFSCLY